jgi:hypothetical protein
MSDPKAMERMTVTRREAAEMLSVSERTLWGATSPRGPIPCVRIGRRCIRYPVKGLKDYLAQNSLSG